ncbi:hypothetical protein T4D_13025 [Trichinella pseudospiralis]|uniref:Uncharacterized protein n=1 Tax=Trichinella pseudospiralis TaxID=6337 RepID=A0A0V1FD96_TRIPS|nr:hypothetical protein T4D_13025 [Trichinella pseudospiralis]
MAYKDRRCYCICGLRCDPSCSHLSKTLQRTINRSVESLHCRALIPGDNRTANNAPQHRLHFDWINQTSLSYSSSKETVIVAHVNHNVDLLLISTLIFRPVLRAKEVLISHQYLGVTQVVKESWHSAGQRLKRVSLRSITTASLA